jgi:hypothetical protein
LNPGEALAGVGTGPLTETDRGATTTIAALTAITMHGRVTFLPDAPVSASCNVRTSPTAITALPRRVSVGDSPIDTGAASIERTRKPAQGDRRCAPRD